MHRLLALALVSVVTVVTGLPLQTALAAKPLNAQIVSGPDGATADTTPTFRFKAASGARFTCRLDKEKAKKCASPKALRPVPDGPHTLTVIAYDRSGHHGRPAHRTFVVDSQPPDTTIVAGPASVASGTAAFTFASSETPASFECRLDDGPLATCGSAPTFTGLADGPHRLLVRSCDAVGNCDPSPALRAWAVDTTPPTTAIGSGPAEGSVTSSNDPSFTFSADPATGSTFECALDGPPFSTCTSPRAYTDTADGQHTFAVRACDPVGNCDATPASRTWTIDTTAPDTTITSAPNSTTIRTSATFTYTATPSPDFGGFQCSLDQPGFSACPSQQFYGFVSANVLHTFRVRACDTLGNCGPGSTPWSWTSVPSGAAANNETNSPAEADACNIQFPTNATVAVGQQVSVFGRIFEAGVTAPAGESSQVVAQLGHGPSGSDPRGNAAWTWTDAFFNVQSLDVDEYHGIISANLSPGTYAYAMRFSLDDELDNSTVTYCDTDGAGSNAGLTFSAASLGVLTVQ